LGVSQSRGPKLFGREIIFEEFQPMCCWYLNVTDRQTDGQTDDLLSHYRALRWHRAVKTVSILPIYINSCCAELSLMCYIIMQSLLAHWVHTHTHLVCHFCWQC